MGTKTIDAIQSEQIVALETDITTLSTTLNTLVADINQLASKLTTLISNLNNLASVIGNNYISLNVSIYKSWDSGNHTDGTYTNVSLGGGSGTGAKATVTIGVTTGSSSGGGIQSVTITTAGTNYLVGNVLSIPKEAIGNGSSDGGVEVVGDGTSVDGLLKRLTDFDTYYTTHISSKFPPVVDVQGGVRVGYHVGHNTTSAAMEHAHPQGWTGSTGTCLTATVTKNANYPGGVFTNGIANVGFQALATNVNIPTNQTWAGIREREAFPKAHIITDSSGAVTSSDFRMDLFGGQSKNNSYGFGWSVGDLMMSSFGTFISGVFTPAWFATVATVGSQLQARPQDNTPTYRTPHGYLASYNLSNYGDDSPGVGGPAEPTPPAAGTGSETSSHNIVDDSTQSGEAPYTATVSSASTLHSYLLSPTQLLTLSDTEKIARGKQLVRMTKSRLTDSELWGTENTRDNILTSADLLT